MTDPNSEQEDSRTVDDIKAGDPNADPADTTSDEDAERIAADQTASTSKNADKAGKDWNGDPSDAPEPL